MAEIFQVMIIIGGCLILALGFICWAISENTREFFKTLLSFIKRNKKKNKKE